MASCCESKSCEVDALRGKHSQVLWIVLTINASMFIIEGMAGRYAASTSLMADALDMFGDSLVYAFSLFVLSKSDYWQARAALVKGSFMLAFGLGVIGDAAYKFAHPVMPQLETMGSVAALALAANLVCFYLLYCHRSDNLNMSSTWLCSRNDLIANVGVLLAAGCSFFLGNGWPDIIVGTIIAGLFLSSAIGVMRESWQVLNVRRKMVSKSEAMLTIEIRRKRS